MNQHASIRGAIGCAALALLAVVGVARAQAPMPQRQMQGDVAFLNGGAGDEEVQFVKRSMKDYSLALSFARAMGSSAEYVAMVAITIKDAKGDTVFESPAVGPYLLVRLPAGRYTVVATYQSVSKTQPVTVRESASSVTTISWS